MKATRPILAGGAAAVIAAAYMALFPPFEQTRSIVRIDGQRFAEAQNAFAGMLGGSSTAAGELQLLGLHAKGLEGPADAVLLSETEGDCAGRGVYWIRPDAPGKLAITAPHRGSDRHTGALAAALFMETGARAAAWNSAPRHASEKCDNALDLARTPDHLFSAFALGFAQAEPDGLIVQLHGFEGARRKETYAQEAAMILSNGTDNPDKRLLDLADELSLAFDPWKVLVYPIGTSELGATGNVQGQLLREAGFDGFAHIEISAEMRAALVEDAALRARLAAALVRAAR